MPFCTSFQDDNGNGDGGCGEASCRRCLLDKLSNRGLSLDSGNGGGGNGEQCSGARYLLK